MPSAAAVRALGGGQPALEERFRERLAADERAEPGPPPGGLLVRAGFGEGKSHLLGVFEQIALDAGFAVSRVVVSKETPLYDPAKLLSAAVEGLRVPGAIGRGLEEVGLRIRHRLDEPAYADLTRRLGASRELDSRFAATLYLYENGTHDEELADRIVRFWSGDKLAVGEMRSALRQLGQAATYPLEPIKARELALQTFAFVPMLVRAAGLGGWALLIDEVELIGRYSRLQRARAYAELARWLEPRASADSAPVTVAAITDDFESAVLRDPRKADLDQIGPYMEARDPDVAQAAERGMALIGRAELLRGPDHDSLKATYATLRRLHSRAYAWEPPEVSWPEALGSTAMRTYVRAWINAWDVHRLYPGFEEGEAPYAVEPVPTDYREPPPEPRAEASPERGAETSDPDGW